MIAALRPGSLAVAGPFLALWLVAPLVAYWLSRPVPPERHLSRLRGPALPPSHRTQDLALLRDLHGRRGPRPASGQLPGDARADGRPPDVAHEHRDGAPLDPGRPRPRLHPHRRAGRAARGHAVHHGGAGALRRPSAQLVRHADPGAPVPPLRLHGGQRQPRGRAPGPGRGSAAAGRRAPVRGADLRRPSGHRARWPGSAWRVWPTRLAHREAGTPIWPRR